MKILMMLMALLFGTTITYAKEMAGYDFNKYPAKIYQGKKAPLILGDWRMFRTHLKDTHADGEIGFAGNYMVSMWGCGTGCVSGAMIDKRTGKVYGFPIGEGVPYDASCSYEFKNPLENESVVFYPDSRLFIIRNCVLEQIGDSNQYLEKFSFVIKVWDEKAKKFKSLKTVNKTYQATHDW